MSRAELVVVGEVVVAARPDGLETAEALGITDGRVVSAGRRDEVVRAAAPGARVVDARGAAVIPGIHDFHLHLVGLARRRREVLLDDAPDAAAVAARIERAAAERPPDAWVLGRGWGERQLGAGTVGRLAGAAAGRPVWLSSHDGHSAWVSPAALALARVDARTVDPAGGRIERAVDGAPNGILRETARDLVEPVVVRPTGDELAELLDETLAELWSLGITGVTDAGAYTTDKGRGRYAALGDEFSAVAELAPRVDGRVRLTLNVPAAALLDGSATAAGLRTGAALPGVATIRAGWAKVYADGALGSRTAALFAPYTCGDLPDEIGILRVDRDALDALLAAGRASEIALAIHAIGDRTVATVLDALAGAPPAHSAGRHAPADRIEHAQLVRPVDRPRFAALDVVASMQPVHAAADRQMVEACWAGRVAHAYATRSLADAGALLAFGSDAPVETHNPWHGVVAAVRRRHPGEADPGWRAHEAIAGAAALSAYTLAPAVAMRRADEGSLRPGAVADLAVLDVDLATLLDAGDELAAARSVLTLVGGREVHRA